MPRAAHSACTSCEGPANAARFRCAQVILKTTLIVAATELPSDFSPLKATLVFPIKVFIDEGLKKFKTKKNPAWA